METFELDAIELDYHGQAIKLNFDDAVLVIVTEYGDRLWYVDINGVRNDGLLTDFNRQEDIRISMNAASSKGALSFSGIGYLHPNEPNQAAAIRGDGELLMQPHSR